ncbi:MAG: phosphomethylpyrimidine synthase, partial [Limisphaerales bacterium]
MIANKEEADSPSRQSLPCSTRVYLSGQQYPELRVPMREIALHDTHSTSGEVTHNPPVRVYDTSGPWGDPSFRGQVSEGLPSLRADWIQSRGDVESYEG